MEKLLFYEIDEKYIDFLSQFSEHLFHNAKVSPTTIQNLRSGNAESVKYKTLSNIMQKLGYALQPVKMATL